MGDGGESVHGLREQISHLHSLFTLSVLMSDGRDEQQIMKLATSSVEPLAACTPIASLLTTDPGGLRDADGAPLAWPELTGQLQDLGDATGPVTGTGSAWAAAYAMRAIGGHAGHLVVGADGEPTPDQLRLLQMLAQQTGCALTTTALHRRDRETADVLLALNAELAEVNTRLAASVADLEQRRKTYETLTAVAAAGAGEAGIAAALHELTGMPVAAEDQFGNLRAWAGPDLPDPYPRPASRRRAEMLADARRSPKPIRDRDRVIAVAQPRDEVLGVLALVDPHRRVGEHELFALEHGAMVLAMELVHRRGMAETELRLRRDLVDDLLSGTDDESGLSRAQALGHDLSTPHQVLVVRWPDATEDAVVRAVEHAVTRVLDARVLLARRPGFVVLIAPGAEDRADSRWEQLNGAVTGTLRSAGPGAVGVGGVCTFPSELPRSYAEAQRALKVRLASSTPAGVTAYDDLGVFRLLTLGEDDADVKEFVREWLGPLLDYDETSGSALVTTLWRYLECGGNYDSTARALMIHRSTLRYRLRRIRELSGLDLGSVDTRLNVHLATRAWHILRGAS